MTGVTLASAAVLAGAFWGWSVFARTQYDDSQARLTAALEEQTAAEKAFVPARPWPRIRIPQPP